MSTVDCWSRTLRKLATDRKLVVVRSNGLLAPWVAHLIADSVIFVLILQAATRAS
jgi:hypothetical protein